jgi:CRISPR-associated helicase Cas3/CRISPR-associated endonuclease Cas3-HD
VLLLQSIAHIRQSDGKIQTVEEHSRNVQRIAEWIGDKIGVKHIAGLAGLLHDAGKFSDKFANYILSAAQNPDNPPKRGSVDHSTAGGQLLDRFIKSGPRDKNLYLLTEIVCNAIISHHAYLHDFISPDAESPYLARIQEKHIDDLADIEECFHRLVMDKEQFRRYTESAARELAEFLTKPSSEDGRSRLMFLTKFVFSSLIDADRTDTRLFEENKTWSPEADRKDLFAGYYQRLLNRVSELNRHSGNESLINHYRRMMSDFCDSFAEQPSNIYKLSIPTGGGKTLSSLRYGLRHALHHQKDRVIYIIPYTTIIEQNADEVRQILQDDERILEHHSNVIDDLDTHDDEWADGLVNANQRLKLAKDNWDAPIIFTTMVQFLNVFYAYGSRNIRRLHNLSRSVIVFDEVQKVPVHCVSLFNRALNFLNDFCGSSIVLCTATQPALDYVEHKLNIPAKAEIIPRTPEITCAFKRVDVIDRASQETFDTDKLASFVREQVAEMSNILVILNTRTVVKKLYQQLKARFEEGECSVYHLSTSMCAAHRTDILQEIRKRLERDEKLICVSTQLIEAGVDISFNCVIRSLAGLDSIAQAAGRCNRHGKDPVRPVYIVDHAEERLDKLPEIKIGKSLTRTMLIDMKRDPTAYGGDIFSDAAISRYFADFYHHLRHQLNYFIPMLHRDMTSLLIPDAGPDSLAQTYAKNKGVRPPLFNLSSMRTAAEHFQVIDSPTTAVLVPYGEEGKEIIAHLNGDISFAELSNLIRRAQRYTVNLYKHELDQLAKNDGLMPLVDGKIHALVETAYDLEYGVNPENDGEWDLYML